MLDGQPPEKATAKRLAWGIPWPALDDNQQPTTADVQQSATIDHCIAIQRHSARIAGRTDLTDEQLLSDFIAIHHAQPLTEGGGSC